MSEKISKKPIEKRFARQGKADSSVAPMVAKASPRGRTTPIKGDPSAGKKKAAKSVPIPEKTRMEIVNSLIETISRKTMAQGSALAAFWPQLDRSARQFVVSYLAVYTNSIPKGLEGEERSKLNLAILKATKRQIRLLKKAALDREAFQKIRDARGRKVSDLEPLSYPQETEFSLVLDREVQRLVGIAARYRSTLREKHLGLAGSYLQLVWAQDFVALWATTMSRNVRLGSTELAALIPILEAERGFGERDDNREANLSIAIRRFRANKRNAVNLQLLRERVMQDVVHSIALRVGHEDS